MMLKGKTALVTGASRGIGQCIALTLAKQGAKVAINYRGSEDSARAVADKIKENGGEALLVKADVSDYKQTEKMMAAIKEKWGGLDILVNNAGIVRDRTLKNMTPEEWDAVISTTLTGVFNVTKNSLPILNDNGSIVNISSFVGMSGNFGQSNYAAAKAGIIGFTKSVAKELAKRNIRANAVAPGFIDTEMTKNIAFIRKFIVKMLIPLKRVGSVEDVANIVAFLASDQSSYVTGQVIRVDGGLML